MIIFLMCPVLHQAEWVFSINQVQIDRFTCQFSRGPVHSLSQNKLQRVRIGCHPRNAWEDHLIHVAQGHASILYCSLAYLPSQIPNECQSESERNWRQLNTKFVHKTRRDLGANWSNKLRCYQWVYAHQNQEFTEKFAVLLVSSKRFAMFCNHSMQLDSLTSFLILSDARSQIKTLRNHRWIPQDPTVCAG